MKKPNRFTVTARNVKNLNAGAKLFIWITKSFQASSGQMTLSQADVPPGTYDLKMFGEAMSGSSKVTVEVVAETTVTANSQGKYNMVIDTFGIPAGTYRIEEASDSKTIRIGSSSYSPSYRYQSSSDVKETSSVSPAKQIPDQMTPDMVRCYASQINLDTKDPRQYAEAENRLKQRLSGGYWKVIVRDEPLTETAGDCDQKFCMVRVIDACTVCREGDMLIKANKSAERPKISEKNATISHQNMNQPQAVMEKKGFTNMFIDWILTAGRPLGG